MAAAQQAARKAIYAAPDFLKPGEGASQSFGFMKHVAISLTIGAALGFVYKTWHWNEKRYIAHYYADLAKKEAQLEAVRVQAIQAKFKELEEELLS